jgi:hypothetical protein
VQLAERALQSAIQTVLDDESVKLAEQSEPQKQETLGAFIRKLKRRVKLPVHLNERLYEFLKMRNRLVHEFEHDFHSEKGREEARLFLVDLMIRALTITGLFTAVFQVWAQDEHGVDFFEVEADETRLIIKWFESHFGKLAREILAGRRHSLGEE